MDDLAKLEAALVKADAAGDVDGARRLAQAVKAARSGSPTPEQREAPGAAPLPTYGDTLKKGVLNVGKGLLMGGPMGAVGAAAGEAMGNAQTLMDRGAYNAGGAVTDMTGSPAAGFATNVGIQAIPTVLGAVLGKSVGQKPTKEAAEWLMQTAVKPDRKDLLSGAGRRAVTTMLDEGINPTRGGMDKAGRLVDQLHKQVEGAIGSSTANVSLENVGQKYLEQYAKAIAQTNPQADLSIVSKTFKDFSRSPLVAGQSEIPVQLAHEIKRGTQQALGGKAYGEMGSASMEAQKALARYLREGVADAVPSVVAPLKRESALMNVRDVAMNRAIAEGNKNPMGLAALRMDDPLSAVSFMADKSALLKALAARMLYQNQGVAPTTAGAVVGAGLGNMSGASQ